MAQVLVKFTEPIRGSDGRTWDAQACGDTADDGLWEGWIEFTPEGGGEPARTARETEQPNLADLQYWAQGLTMVYLEGALARATDAPVAPIRDSHPQAPRSRSRRGATRSRSARSASGRC